MKYTYRTVLGLVTIEVDEKWHGLLEQLDTEEANANRRHIRNDHKYAPGTPISLNTVDESAEIPCKPRNIPDMAGIINDLRTALERLTHMQRFCFIETELGGRTQQSVADELGIAQKNVNKHIKAARKKIKIFFTEGV